MTESNPYSHLRKSIYYRDCSVDVDHQGAGHVGKDSRPQVSSTHLDQIGTECGGNQGTSGVET